MIIQSSAWYIVTVHPCDRPDNAGCEQVCNKEGDNGVCACNEGYKLVGNACNKSKYSSCLLLVAKTYIINNSFINSLKIVSERVWINKYSCQLYWSVLVTRS